jgi:hypothetical protein
MSNEIEVLISLLKIIDNNDLIDVRDNGVFNDHPLVNAAKFLADQYLIGEDGHPDREMIDIVVNSGFRIFPGEVDKFGWLTGYIELSRGIIVFG